MCSQSQQPSSNRYGYVATNVDDLAGTGSWMNASQSQSLLPYDQDNASDEVSIEHLHSPGS